MIASFEATSHIKNEGEVLVFAYTSEVFRDNMAKFFRLGGRLEDNGTRGEVDIKAYGKANVNRIFIFLH